MCRNRIVCAFLLLLARLINLVLIPLNTNFWGIIFLKRLNIHNIFCIPNLLSLITLTFEEGTLSLQWLSYKGIQLGVSTFGVAFGSAEFALV